MEFEKSRRGKLNCQKRFGIEGERKKKKKERGRRGNQKKEELRATTQGGEIGIPREVEQQKGMKFSVGKGARRNHQVWN